MDRFSRHFEENYEVIDEAISGVCYYFIMRLPRRFAPRNDEKTNHTTTLLIKRN
ncbi:hypothetical protein [Rickettsia hoogstraalii]|uniref:hypothetical protein n=1 Tax=Rickettsia hoogstraalii TaxID=467174 RepID=UPI000A815E2C|nr:hypothetical protein [Rickettsia hoogstraalii]